MQACNLSATDLACRRGDRVLFRGFNVSMREGDALHITGSNGIGKSSLMRILAGLLLPFDGSVARVGAAGLLDERPALDPQVALGDALAFWAGVDSSHELADT
ncbi:MAG: ATP-binding cassette domain-containing protein, partial [Pontixanthobacter sp.]